MALFSIVCKKECFTPSIYGGYLYDNQLTDGMNKTTALTFERTYPVVFVPIKISSPKFILH